MTPRKTSLAALTLGAFGIVYGGIGTSVLYAVKEIFGSGHVPFNFANVMGVMSLIFWTLTVVVSLKYVALILRADNHSEGGLVAMLALASSAVRHKPALRARLVVLGMFGAALFYGDGVIAPAISVLSAVEGLEILSPGFKKWVVPLTLTILLALFVVQSRVMSGVGKLFGPLTLLWFLAIGALGLWRILERPEILFALSPHYALSFLWQSPKIAFAMLGSVVLCVTGAEALYADLGHFGKNPIRLSWFFVVMPCLTLNYFGQGAFLLARPDAVQNPFYMMAPEWALAPLIVLATLATVVASQALIAGAFSVTKQAIQLGYLPPLHIVHTSAREAGQIYIPVVNWSLFASIVLAVGMFGSSGNLAAAYGVAATLNMLITTILTFFVLRHAWNYPFWVCALPTVFFLAIDALFFSSNLLKLAEGGFFPLLIGGSVFLLMKTWRDGCEILNAKLLEQSTRLSPFLDSIFASPPPRVEGAAVFFCPDSGVAPTALLHNLKHNKVIHELNLFVTVKALEVPWVGLDRRVQITPLGHRCWSVTLRFGFKNNFDVPLALQQLHGHGCSLDPMHTSYFLSRDVVVPTVGSGMALWREKLFASMHLNASTAAEFLLLPNDSVVELGSKIEI